MPRPDSGPPGQRLELALALALGCLGLTVSLLAGSRPLLHPLALVAWSAALAVFGLACSKRRIRFSDVAVSAAAACRLCARSCVSLASASLAAACALTVLAARTWIFVPVALAAWAAAAHLLGFHWRWLLSGAVACMAGAAITTIFGATDFADSLAVVGYTLAWVACGTAAVARSQQ